MEALFKSRNEWLRNPNLDKLSADIIHHSRHGEQFKRGLSFDETTAIPMEMEASQFTVGVINNIGGWDAEVLKGYEKDAAKGHLPPGWKDKSTPRSGRYTLCVEYHCPISIADVKVSPFWGSENGTIKSNVIEIEVVR